MKKKLVALCLAVALVVAAVVYAEEIQVPWSVTIAAGDTATTVVDTTISNEYPLLQFTGERAYTQFWPFLVTDGLDSVMVNRECTLVTTVQLANFRDGSWTTYYQDTLDLGTNDSTIDLSWRIKLDSADARYANLLRLLVESWFTTTADDTLIVGNKYNFQVKQTFNPRY